MRSSAPEVLTGTRAPRTVRLEEANAKAAAVAGQPAAAVPVQAEYHTYVSRDRMYRVQITAPQSYSSPDGRKQSGGKMIVALFQDNVYRNNHRDPKVRALIDEELQKNPYFGKFGDVRAHYWLASDQNAKTDAARVASAMATLRALPKAAVDQFVAELKQSDAADHNPPAQQSAQ